jgi:hypothetical protein
MNTLQQKIASNGADSLDRVTEKAQNLVESKDQVVSDFKALLSEGEALFKSATGGGSKPNAPPRSPMNMCMAIPGLQLPWPAELVYLSAC